MKKIILLILLFISAKNFAQTNRITYQAVILNPKGEQIPGVNNTNAPMVDKNICLQFQFIDEFSNVEYQETVQTKTDQFGMVNLVIGAGNQTAGYAASFETMEWNALKKSLIVSINTDGGCSSFTEISDQPFTAVPFAFSAINAGNVTGVVDIQNGGTNAVTVLGAKTNLGLENVDNTNDLDKPVSTASQSALNLKEDVVNKSTDISTDGASDTKYPSVKSVKIYVDGEITTSETATQTALDLKVDKVSGERLINASEITKLSNQSGTNTGDQDLSSFATNSALALKANIASPTFTGIPLAPTAEAGTNTTQLATTAFVTATIAILVREVTDEFSATASQTTFTLTQIPSVNSKVKMYVNGIRISNAAYSVSGTTLTYNPANNGTYALSLNDRIQFDYFY